MRGIHVPLATESHYLPDSASLKDRVLAICLENGLLGGLDGTVPDLVIDALDIHLRNLVTATLAKIRKNRLDCMTLAAAAAALPSTNTHLGTGPGTGTGTTGAVEEVLRPDELAFTHALAPHIFIESCHPVTRMMAVSLDDTLDSDSTWASFDMTDKSSQRVKVAKMLDDLI